ncbi:hypothetical protein K445DRAFT_314634 [Daldinia sp. EC12]|nr:hypothetical protein K445DRAFT_314634 [Daldinia sp. EC12]
MLAKHYLPALVLLLPLASSSSPLPPTYITPCPSSPSPSSSWTVTAFSLTDFATPNLITLRADLRRSLSFTVSSSLSLLPKTNPYKCAIDTGYQKVEHIQQFDTWTRACWDAENFLVSPPDPALAFKFESAAGDLESAHPARFSLLQERECGSR